MFEKVISSFLWIGVLGIFFVVLLLGAVVLLIAMRELRERKRNPDGSTNKKLEEKREQKIMALELRIQALETQCRSIGEQVAQHSSQIAQEATRVSQQATQTAQQAEKAAQQATQTAQKIEETAQQAYQQAGEAIEQIRSLSDRIAKEQQTPPGPVITVRSNPKYNTWYARFTDDSHKAKGGLYSFIEVSEGVSPDVCIELCGEDEANVYLVKEADWKRSSEELFEMFFDLENFDRKNSDLVWVDCTPARCKVAGKQFSVLSKGKVSFKKKHRA